MINKWIESRRSRIAKEFKYVRSMVDSKKTVYVFEVTHPSLLNVDGTGNVKCSTTRIGFINDELFIVWSADEEHKKYVVENAKLFKRMLVARGIYHEVLKKYANN